MATTATLLDYARYQTLFALRKAQSLIEFNVETRRTLRCDQPVHFEPDAHNKVVAVDLDLHASASHSLRTPTRPGRLTTSEHQPLLERLGLHAAARVAWSLVRPWRCYIMSTGACTGLSQHTLVSLTAAHGQSQPG